MSRFPVSGRFAQRHGGAEFEPTAEAENESVAREHVLSRLGSRHGSKRTQTEREDVSDKS